VEKNTASSTQILRQVNNSLPQKITTRASAVAKRQVSKKRTTALEAIQAIVENGGSQSLK
jgi:hypothetical protein